MTKVTIIIPAYNSELHISKALESVKSQSFQSWEILVIDDDSNDRTAAIVNNFSQLDSRIQYHHIQHSGQATARYYGTKLARGEYLFFLDSDDLMNSDVLGEMVMVADLNGFDCLFGDYYNFRMDYSIHTNQIDSISTSFKEFEKLFIDGEMQFFGKNFIELAQSVHGMVIWGKLFRREIWTGITTNHLASQKFGEDFLYLHVFLSRTSQIGFLDRIIVLHRLHKRSITASRNSKAFDILSSFKRAQEVYQAENLVSNDDINLLFANWFQFHLHHFIPFLQSFKFFKEYHLLLQINGYSKFKNRRQLSSNLYFGYIQELINYSLSFVSPRRMLQIAALYLFKLLSTQHKKSVLASISKFTSIVSIKRVDALKRKLTEEL